MNASDLTTLVDSLPDSGPTLSIDVGFESSLTRFRVQRKWL